MTDLEKELVEKLAKAWVGTEQNPWDLVSEEQRKSWEALCIEGYLPHIRSHTQALVAAAYAACAEHQAGDYNGGDYDWGCICGARGHNGLNGETDTWQAHILSLTPADAARELERREMEARIDQHDGSCQSCIGAKQAGYKERCSIHADLERQLASLSKPAPVERSNENG